MNKPITQPQALIAQHAVLGAMMLDNDCIPTVAEMLRATDFNGVSERTVYDTITNLYFRSKPADAVSVLSELDETYEEFVSGLAMVVGTSATVEHHADKVREAATRRDIAREAAAIGRMAEADGRPVAEILGESQSRIVGLSSRQPEAESIKDVISGALKDAAAASRGVGLHGV